MKVRSRFGSKMTDRMQQLHITIADVADATTLHYEHVRKLINGRAFPSRRSLKAISEVLQLRMHDLEKLTVADRIERRYGQIPFELVGQNPELAILEHHWIQLTLAQRQMFKTLIIALSEMNRRTALKRG